VTGGTFVLCLSVNGVDYTQQTGQSVLVIDPADRRITAVAPSIVPNNTATLLTLSDAFGTIPGTSTSRVAIAASAGCGAQRLYEVFFSISALLERCLHPLPIGRLSDRWNGELWRAAALSCQRLVQDLLQRQ